MNLANKCKFEIKLERRIRVKKSAINAKNINEIQKLQ